MTGKIKAFFKDKNRQVIVFLAVALALSVFTYAAISVNNFNGGYSPPSVLNIRWGDYWTSSSMTTLNTSNAVTSYPRWTAEYKYRSIFIGMGRSGSSYNPPNTCTVWMYIVYSKKPVSDLFTFEYVPNGDRASTSLNKKGYIRAYMPNDKYNVRDTSQNPVSDIFIKCTSTTDFTNFMVSPIVASDLGDIGLYSGAYASGSNHYFEFDFYYECAGEHQQNAYPLTIDGLRSVANVPYGYILKCEEHAPPGGSAGGGSSSSGGGSSSSGDSSSGGGGSSSGSGGSSEYPWEDNANTPDYGSGSSGSSGSGSSVSASEGTTGEKGDTWTLPEYDVPGLPWGDDDLNIPDMPEVNLPAFPEPDFNFPEFPDMPEVDLPVVPYEPGENTWPPEFPSVG